ncbi:unnamed protein product [Cylicocyclus nassatus]|uniref:Uncharacterized protein n=1 Tax=Cylicocyclus nassatus TaxID=53992 RepID=A0AA36DJY8_CYLNA|nr:unnamed protein product [Cylicocyclus nassatus]
MESSNVLIFTEAVANKYDSIIQQNRIVIVADELDVHGCQHKESYPARDGFFVQRRNSHTRCLIDLFAVNAERWCTPASFRRLVVTYVTLGLRFAEIRTGADTLFLRRARCGIMLPRFTYLR